MKSNNNHMITEDVFIKTFLKILIITFLVFVGTQQANAMTFSANTISVDGRFECKEGLGNTHWNAPFMNDARAWVAAEGVLASDSGAFVTAMNDFFIYNIPLPDLSKQVTGDSGPVDWTFRMINGNERDKANCSGFIWVYVNSATPPEPPTSTSSPTGNLTSIQPSCEVPDIAPDGDGFPNTCRGDISWITEFATNAYVLTTNGRPGSGTNGSSNPEWTKLTPTPLELWADCTSAPANQADAAAKCFFLLDTQDLYAYENGACGSANGTTVSSQPTGSEACSAGTYLSSPVDSSSQYLWSCTASPGGSSDNTCYANKVSAATINAPNCVIAAGGNSCNITATWDGTNITAPRIKQNGTLFSILEDGSSYRSLAYGTHTFTYYDNETLRDSDTATASCTSGTTWDGLACEIDVAPPTTPTGLMATPGACGTGRIDVSWNSSSGATSYRLRDSTTTIYNGGNTSYNHTGLAAGSAHSYTVRAQNSGGDSAYSSVVTATAPAACLLPDLTAQNTSPSSGSTYTTTQSITFEGSAINSAAASITEGGWADVEIDYDRNGGVDANLNAYGGVRLGSFNQSQTKILSATANAGVMPAGDHRYRFSVDTDGTGVIESNESNNYSVWVNFTVTEIIPTITQFEVCDIGITSCSSSKIVNPDTPLTLVWDSNNSDDCSRLSGPTDFNTGGLTSGTDDITSNSSPGVTDTYTIVCSFGGLNPRTAAVDVTVVSGPTLTPNPRVVEEGGETRLDWNITSGETCALTGGGQTWNIDATTVTDGSLTVTNLQATTEFTLSCPFAGDTTTTVEVIPKGYET